MQHDIPVEKLGPQAEHMATAVQTCVHCGFCLPACPTYEVMGEEMDSPRGRIFLMKEVLEGNVEIDEAAPYIDRCLGCEGCVTACPSGVQYGHLITPYRAHAEKHRKRTLFDRLLRWFILSTLPYPGRFRWALRMGGLGRLVRFAMPKRMRGMLELLPSRIPKRVRLPERSAPADGKRRARVALLTGCAQQVLEPDINSATIQVLVRNGVEVLVPPQQVCCGALAAHTGDLPRAAAFAKQNLAAFPDDVDAVITNAAGCGSGMREYALWLAGEPEEERADQFVSRIRDVSEFLDDIGMIAPARLSKPTRVAYHDACHLAHAQKITAAPRNLLRQVENLELVEIPQGEICCGSAGTYNLEQPETAAELGRQKAAAIGTTSADAVATGNIGCMAQIASHLQKGQESIAVWHTMQLLDQATNG